MKDKRIGNDINVAWAIMKKEGTPYSLAGKDITIYLKTRLEKEEVKDFSVAGNTISWTFYGKDQKHLGKHDLELVINENEVGMITTDKCGFVNLVSCSCHEGGSDEGNITTESIELTTTLEFVAGEGGGSYDDSAIWEAVTKLNEDKVDKVEGLGLSQENFTTEEKEKLSGLENYDDTKIKQDIANLQAEDVEIGQELTELSAEVSELSERVDNLPTAESSVFVAEYGVTTLEEIKTAAASKKIVYCYYNNMCLVLSILSSNEAIFSASKGNYLYALACNYKNEWSAASYIYSHELKTLDNGNVQVTIAGKSAEVATPQYVDNAIQQSGGGGGMTTPSGDPMHYMYEAAGATYNATDEDIPMVGIYGDSYVHKAKHWHLNELGDLTTEEIREVYVKSANLCNMVGLDRALASTKIRTNIPIIDRELPLMGALSRMQQNMGCFAANSKCETICIFSPSIPMTSATIKEYNLNEGNGMFFGCSKLKKVLNVLPISKMSSVSRLLWEAPVLEEIRANGLKTSIEVKHSPVLSNASILYMIENEASTSAITITLHADAYDRAMADADIQAALAAHTNVTLAK